MRIHCFVCFWCLVFVSGISSKAQVVVSPVVPDFTDIRAMCVVATWGTGTNAFETVGLKPGRHEVISEQGTDMYTSGRLPYLPEGVSRVVCLGRDDNKGSEALTYHFRVDPERPLLRVRFAAVFLDRRYNKNSSISIRVLDASGKLIDGCSNYTLTTLHGNPSMGGIGKDIAWFDWRNELILNMSRCSGEAVQVQFVNSDYVGWTGLAYIYFTAECISDRMEMKACDDREVTLAAPVGYRTYRWFNGVENRECRLEKGSEGSDFSCRAVSLNDCTTQLQAAISAGTPVPTEKRVFVDTIQQGEGYEKHTFRILPLTKSGNYVYHRTFGDGQGCRMEGDYTLHLTVRQRYYPLVAEVCAGEDYVEQGFAYRNLAPGLYFDTLFLKNGQGQDSVVTLRLGVSSSFELSGTIEGNREPCAGSTEIYRAPYAIWEGKCSWEVPDGAEILSGGIGSNIRLRFSDRGEAGRVVFHGQNGCGAGELALEVVPRPMFWSSRTDTICQGEEYHSDGFHLPRAQQPESRMYYQSHQTQGGCDSTYALLLTVLPTPAMKVVTHDSVVCAGKEVELLAVPKTWTDGGGMDTWVSVGDVYCTDGSIVSPTEYATGVKEAEGVVFWVDESGKHGWIAHKAVQSYGKAWTTNEYIVIPPELLRSKEEFYSDTAGYQNTKTIWALGRLDDYPLLKEVPFEQGWYVPAAGQLNRLRGNFFLVNETLRQMGGVEFKLTMRESNEECFCWVGSTFMQNNRFSAFVYQWIGGRGSNQMLGEDSGIYPLKTYETLHYISPVEDVEVTLRTVRSF